MYKYNSLLSKSQHRNKNYSQDIISEQLKMFIEGMTPSERSLFDLVAWWWLRFERRVWVSQQRLADSIGVTRQYVNRLLGRMCALGIVKSVYRHMTTCLYSLNEYFSNPFNTSWLVPYFPAFHLQSLLKLTQVKKILKGNKNIYINNSNGEKISDKKVLSSLVRSSKMLGEVNDGYTFDPRITKMAAEMGLSSAGKCRISAFPLEAIEYALECYRRHKDTLMDDYGRWLCVCAHTYCKREGLIPNWNISDRFMEALGISHDEPLIDRRERVQVKTLPSTILANSGFTCTAKAAAQEPKKGRGIYAEFKPETPIRIEGEIEQRTKMIEYARSLPPESKELPFLLIRFPYLKEYS